MFHRAKTITSDDSQKLQEIQNIRQNLTKNGYSSSFINKTINKPPSSDNSIQNASRHLTLPYIEGLSQNIRRLFSPHDVAIHFKPNFTVKNTVTKLKDKCPEKKKSNLVYEISCPEPNCTIKYVGETQQRLEKRIDQHRSAIIRGDKNHSGISEHCVENMHFFDKDNVKILHNNLKFYKERKLAESIHIRKTRNNCNRDLGTYLPEVYSSVLF